MLAYKLYAINFVYINYIYFAFFCKQYKFIKHNNTYYIYYKNNSSFTCFNYISFIYTIINCLLLLILYYIVCFKKGYIKSNYTYIIFFYKHAKLILFA